MKKLILSFSIFLVFTANILAQTGICNDFSNSTGLSTYPASGSTVTYSVAGNELTITFTNTTPWQNEVKWDFPSPINISSLSNPKITYSIKVNSLTISGTGAGCASANFLPLGVSLYDGTASGGSDYTYNDGSTSSGYYSSTYAAGTNDIGNTPSTFDNTNVIGISIKAADGGWANCSTPLINGVIVIKNLNIGSGTCGTTSINNASGAISSSKLYPNPVSDMAKVELNLKSASAVKVTLSDIMGKEVMTIADGTFAEITREFSVANLNKGIYTVNYYINGEAAKAELLMIK